MSSEFRTESDMTSSKYNIFSPTVAVDVSLEKLVRQEYVVLLLKVFLPQVIPEQNMVLYICLISPSLCVDFEHSDFFFSPNIPQRITFFFFPKPSS